jgi:hypothetical protein
MKNKLIKGYIKVPKWMLKDFSEIERERLAKLAKKLKMNDGK